MQAYQSKRVPIQSGIMETHFCNIKLTDASQHYLPLKFSAELGVCVSEVHYLIKLNMFRKVITHNTYMVSFLNFKRIFVLFKMSNNVWLLLFLNKTIPWVFKKLMKDRKNFTMEYTSKKKMTLTIIKYLLHER